MPRILAGIGRFSAAHRLLVAAVWVAVMGGLVVLVFSGAQISDPAGSAPSSKSVDALNVVNEKFPGATTTSSTKTLQLVLETKGSDEVTDAATTAEIKSLLVDAAAIPNVTGVTDPFDAKAPYVSKDQTTIVSTLSFKGLKAADEEKTYNRVLKLANQARSDFHAEVGGQIYNSSSGGLGIGELAGVVIAFVVLFLTFGSLLAAGVNLVVAIAGVGVGVLGILGYSVLNPIEGTTITLAIMLGLAVGIDYSLLILTRFRAELREGRKVVDAVSRATGTAGTSVVFAGATVIIALAGLSITGIGTIRNMGLAGALGVFVAMLAAITLLPVFLRTLGYRALPKRQRNVLTPAEQIVRDEKSTFLSKWVGFIVKRPVVAAVGVVVILGIVSAPILTMQTANSVPGGDDPNNTRRLAYNLIVDKFGGVQSPLIVLAQGDDIKSEISAIEKKLASLDHVETAISVATTSQNDAALFTVISTQGPIDNATKDLVSEIRDNETSISGVQLDVTGETAVGIDSATIFLHALIEYIIVIVALSLILLIVMFRSLLVPLIATLGYLLSVGACLGVSTAVFQWGWLDPLITAPQGNPMLSVLPIILVGILFGLGMDYQVFLVGRIQEEHAKGKSPVAAIVSGFKKSGPVVVAAAAIMTFVFAGFAGSPIAVAAEIGLGLVAGVLADAFLVRMILMPALLTLLGEKAWWIPAWLDRILPHLDSEGHALDDNDPDVSNQPELVGAH